MDNEKRNNYDDRPSYPRRNFDNQDNRDRGDEMPAREGFGKDNFDKRRLYLRKKICRFCTDKSIIIDYKNADILRRFTTEGGKIIPRRITGNCAKHQRQIAAAIKIARFLAFLPYVKK